jgi:signal transduction histidine kinase
MKFLPDRSWGLSGLLVVTASLPTLLALLVVAFMHVQGNAQIERDLDNRATLVAAALAEASEYGLVSGNPAALDRLMRELLKQDSAIAAIDILDAARQPFVSLRRSSGQAGLRSVERAVRSNVPDLDFFDSPMPHVSLSEDVQPTYRLGPVSGHVVVSMSGESLLGTQRRQLGMQIGIIVGAGLAGLVAVLLLGRRLSASLASVMEALASMQQGRYDLAEGPAAVGTELRRVQGSVQALAEVLAANATTPRGGPGLFRARPPAPAGGGAPGGGDGRRDDAQHARVARRIASRLDAGLIAIRLSARHAARLADLALSEEVRRHGHQTAMRILAIADQVNAAGPALIDPMRAHIVEELGLDAALEELLWVCALAHPSCVFALRKDGDLAGVEASQAALLHRAVQEAIAHVVACSDASQAAVHVQTQPGRRAVRVVVTDNGQGEASVVSATRLQRMREQLVSWGGEMDVRQSSQDGTTVSFTLPASPAA